MASHQRYILLMNKTRYSKEIYTVLTLILRHALIFEKLLHFTFMVTKLLHVQRHAFQSVYACPVVGISPGHRVRTDCSCMLP